MKTATLSYTVPEYQIEREDGKYRDAIPVPAEELPLDFVAEWFREQNAYATPDAAARAASLLLRAIGERAWDSHIITGATCTMALAAGSALTDDAAADPRDLWDVAADAERRLQEHYPAADMSDHVVLPYDTQDSEIAILCGECTAYLTNAERPDDGDYAAALDAMDSDVRAAERAPLSPRLRMHYGVIEAENTDGVCECCDRDLFDSPDDGRAHVWAY